MMAIIKINPFTSELVDAITGWMFGSDVHELRRQCEGSFDASVRDLARILYAMEFPSLGKHRLNGNYVLLVSANHNI